MKKNIVWVPISEFAREYNKSRVTIVRWIEESFIFSLGVTVKRDVTGHWYIGKPQERSVDSEHSASSF